MRRRARLSLVGLACAVALPLAHDAAADQVRWDVDLEEGTARRVLTSKPRGEGDADFGFGLDAAAHVALLPLVRIGLYAHGETSPIPDRPTRDLVAGGLDVRLALPWRVRDLRAYVRLGLGEVATFAAGGAVGDPLGSTGASFVASASGDFTEVPLALGLAYRLERRLSITAELGARVGFAFGGSAYRAESSGDDALALGLSLGAAWGR